jgi:hypothetical protein
MAHAAMNSAGGVFATPSADFSFRGWIVIDVLNGSSAVAVFYALLYLS